VAKVKRFESGILKDPITVSPTMTVRDVLELTRQHKISGFPVIDKAGKVVGIVTNRDLRFETNLDQPVRGIMTPRERLVTVKEGATVEEGKELIHKHRLERVLVVDDAFELRGLITVKDILKSTEHPLASKDASGRLRVGAAIGVGPGTEERVELLAEAGSTCIVVDTAHGHSQGVLDRVNWVKKTVSAGRGHRRQHRHGGRRAGAGRHGRRRRQGRHRPGLDLHDADRRRCRRAADHRHPERLEALQRAVACR
jgi:IMP dehydrogenase